MLGNAVLQRELRAALRSRRFHVLLGGYVLVSGLIIALAYPHDGRFDPQLSQLGREIHDVFTLAQLVLVVLITPGLAAASIAAERDRQTLESLLVTDLRPGEIIIAKFCSSLIHVVLLVLASVPLTSVSFQLGGISPEELIGSYARILAVACVCAAIGILHASPPRPTLAATVGAYLALPVYFVLLATLWGLGRLGASLLFVESLFAYVIFTTRHQSVRAACYCGAGACVVLFVPLFMTFHNPPGFFVALTNLFPATAVVIWCLMLAASQLASGQAELRLAITPQFTYRLPRLRWSREQRTWLPRALGWDPTQLIPDHWNPVFAQEARMGMPWPWWIVIAVPSLGLLMLLLASPHLYLFLQVVTWSWVIMLVGSAVVGAYCIAPLVERECIGQLLCTTLSPRSLLMGKLLHAACMVLALIWPAFLIPITSRVMDEYSSIILINVLVVLLVMLCAMISLLSGLFCSMLTSYARRALAIAAAGSLLAGLAMSAQVRWFWLPAGFDRHRLSGAGRAEFLYNPVISVWELITRGPSAATLVLAMNLTCVVIALLYACLWLFERRRSKWA